MLVLLWHVCNRAELSLFSHSSTQRYSHPKLLSCVSDSAQIILSKKLKLFKVDDFKCTQKSVITIALFQILE